MGKKTLSFALLLVLLMATYVPMAGAHDAPFPTTYDASAYTCDVSGSPGSSDPAYAYDTMSPTWLFNAYETILFFEPLWELGPYQPPPPEPQRTETFVPQIASALATIEHFTIPITNPKSGLPIYTRFTFPIRAGVTFHHGPFNDATPGLPPYRPAGALGNSNWPRPLRMTSIGIMTPRDVEYSFERVMVQDRAAGPAWLLYEPLLATLGAEDPAVDPDYGLKIDGAVEVVGSNVVFNLANPYPDLAFEQILCSTFASVVSEAWAVNEGDFYLAEVPSGWSNWEYIYNKWNNPRPSLVEDAVDYNPINFKDGGTGPYKISYWTRGVAWALSRYPAYRGGWPAPIRDPATGAVDRLGGYLETVTWYRNPSWPSRLTNLLSGQRDHVDVPRSSMFQVLGGTVAGEPIRCFYPLSKLSAYALFFTMDIDPASPWVPIMLPPNTFGTAGIPPNIFGKHTLTSVDEGLNVRKAFAHAWDYDYAITSGYLGEAIQPSDPIIQGLPYDDPTVPLHDYNLDKTEYYLKLAWGGVDARSDVPGEPVLPEDPAQVTPGALWNGGMRFTCIYEGGLAQYQLPLQKLVQEINAMNPTKFFLTVAELGWDYPYLAGIAQHWVPLFNYGWLADFADPHNFAFPFMHSEGDGPYFQVYEDPFVDALIEQGIQIPDSPYEDTQTNPTVIELKDRDGNGVLSEGDWIKIDIGGTIWWYEVASTAPLTAKLSRERVYFDLQWYYYEQVPSTMIFQPVGRHFEQSWCRGWYENTLFPTTGNYWYHRWKAATHFGDANNDGVVDNVDVSVLSVHWTGPPEGPGGYNPRADLTGGTGGTASGGSGLVRGIPDGKVDMQDKAMVSAYWGYPGVTDGPSHP